MDSFFVEYDRDGDGTIDFAEFVLMYPAIRKDWRFEREWAQFSLADTDGGGVIGPDELHLIIPKGASPEECALWLKRYDKHGHGYITLSDYLAIERAVHRDFVWLAVGTSFVLCTYFVYSRVTKSLLSIFSMEEIEGSFYLKLELGPPALTEEHQRMMIAAGIMLVCFSALVPTIGLFLMYQVRHHIHSRKVATIAGFLTDGYREQVAWVWEFIVLARKLIILGISLFIWDSFIQSFAAVCMLIVSIMIQLQIKPFELASLNLLEVGALSSLLITQLSGILLWYKQQPDKNEYLQPLQYALTGLLFFVNGVVIAGFVYVISWAWLKEKSTTLIQWAPFIHCPLKAAVAMEDNCHWFIAGIFAPHHYTAKRARIRREEWVFLEAERKGKLWTSGTRYKQTQSFLKRHKKRARACKRFCGVAEAEHASAAQRFAYKDDSDDGLVHLEFSESASEDELDFAFSDDNPNGGGGRGRDGFAEGDEVKIPDRSNPLAWWTLQGVARGDAVVHLLHGDGTIVAINPDEDGRVHVEFDTSGAVHRYNEGSWAKLAHTKNWWNHRWGGGIAVGAAVRHLDYGSGIICAISPEDDLCVHVEFESGDAHRITEAGWARLQRVVLTRAVSRAKRHADRSSRRGKKSETTPTFMANPMAEALATSREKRRTARRSMEQETTPTSTVNPMASARATSREQRRAARGSPRNAKLENTSNPMQRSGRRSARQDDADADVVAISDTVNLMAATRAASRAKRRSTRDSRRGKKSETTPTFMANPMAEALATSREKRRAARRSMEQEITPTIIANPMAEALATSREQQRAARRSMKQETTPTSTVNPMESVLAASREQRRAARRSMEQETTPTSTVNPMASVRAPSREQRRAARRSMEQKTTPTSTVNPMVSARAASREQRRAARGSLRNGKLDNTSNPMRRSSRRRASQDADADVAIPDTLNPLSRVKIKQPDADAAFPDTTNPMRRRATQAEEETSGEEEESEADSY